MSNRLTFSLASLIFLIALGLVFVPTSVMAHSTADIGTLASHGHPTDAIPANPNADPPTTLVDAHGEHPSVVSITAVAVATTANNVKKVGNTTYIALDSDTETTNPPDTVNLIVEFDRMVNGGAGATASSTAIVAADVLDSAGFEFVVQDENDFTDGNAFGSNNDQILFGTSTRFSSGTPAVVDNKKFVIPLTFGSDLIPTATKPQRELVFRIRAKADAAKSLRKAYAPNTQLHDGAPSASSSAYSFTLVSELPEEAVAPDDHPPTVAITSAAGTGADAGKVIFTLDFDEPLASEGLGALTVDDITITGGTATEADLSGPTTGDVYKLKVTPTTPGTSVTISLNANSITDVHNNILVPGASTTATYDDTPPTVTITAPSAPDSDGNLTFTFKFSEKIDPKTITLDRSGSDNVRLGVNSDPMLVSTDTTMTTYTILVEPKDPKVDTTVLLLKGSVKDLAGNGLAADAERTYVVPGPPTKETIKPTVAIAANPTVLSCENGGMITVTFADSGTGNSGLAPSTTAAPNALTESEITVTASNGITWTVSDFSATGNTGGSFKITPPTTPRGAANGTTVTIKVAADAIMDVAGNKNAVKSMDFYVDPVITLQPGYTVVVRERHKGITHLSDQPTLTLGGVPVPAVDITKETWECMPDLKVHFGTGPLDNGGGALVVKASPAHDTTKSLAKGSVGISEIMWATDISTQGRLVNDYQARHQWIELHNLNSHPVTVTLFAVEGTDAIPQNAAADEIDRVSNYTINHAVWNVKGQNGDSVMGVDFVSMRRGKELTHSDINKPRVPPRDGNYTSYDGSNPGHWFTSEGQLYLTVDTARTNPPVGEATYDYYGTPGRANTFAGNRAPVKKTVVPLKPFVINEVANRENRLYEWIEIRNTSDKEENLRNYMVSIIKGIGVEEALFTFPNSDVKVPKNGLILIVASDPEDDGEHPLAVGHDVRGGNDQAPGVDANSARYIVAQSNERLYTEGMPDDGNFLLVLRRSEKLDAANAGSKLKTHDWIIDIAGYHSNLGDKNAAPDYSAVWPLKVWQTGPFSKNNLLKESVYYRRDAGRAGIHGENNNDKPAFVTYGYTGVGYRRHAKNIAAHGGTPGYHDIRKNLVADVKDGTVTISEIMFDQGAGKYPQWIELYNSSPTQAVNLHSEAGWRLVIENFDDGKIPVAQISGTLNFKNSEVQTILPQQTVLVTSTRARTAGSSTVNSSVVFIPTRVFSVWADARGELGMGRSTDPILSTEGFHIELIDGKGNSADEVGNLTKRRGRVAAQSVWAWSDVQGEEELENGARSSVIRRYNEWKGGTPVRYSDADIKKMGTTAEGWVSAADTDFRHVGDTWYGHGDDYGTPGFTAGRPLPVSLSKFRPELLETGEIVIRWITESELNNAGFNILRSETRNGQFTQINTSLIAGQGTTSERTTYEWKDTTAKPNVAYYYQIQDVSLDGEINTLRQSRLKGYLTPAGKLTTTWGDLKALQ